MPPSWAELAAKDMAIYGKTFKPVAADDELRLKMLECEKTAPVQAIVDSGRAVLGPGGELPTSIRLPIYEPLVCASFATRNLSGERAKGDSKLAGRDPWSICDYIRDSLQWPASLIFIDAEQTAEYDLDMYHKGAGHCDECKKNPPERPRYDGFRNWHAVFTWAQEKCEVMLYFMSVEFFDSDNCKGEIWDFESKLLSGHANAAVLIALLDPDPKGKAKAYMRELGAHAREGGMDDRSVRAKFSVDNVFDLSHYMIWDAAQKAGRGGEKLNLRDAAKGIVQLRNKIFSICGGLQGDREAYLRDRAQGLACNDVVGDKGHYVRNRYRDDLRRIDINDINKTTAEVLQLRVPHVGPQIAKDIIGLRRRLGGISGIHDLAQIESLPLGGARLSDMEPFLTFNGAQGGARSPATGTQLAPPTTAPSSPATGTRLAPPTSSPPSPVKMPPLPSPAKPSRAELDQMKLPELKALAAKRGITPNGDKRYRNTYIDALL